MNNRLVSAVIVLSLFFGFLVYKAGSNRYKAGSNRYKAGECYEDKGNELWENSWVYKVLEVGKSKYRIARATRSSYPGWYETDTVSFRAGDYMTKRTKCTETLEKLK